MTTTIRTIAFLILTIVGVGNVWADMVSIPQALGQYVNWNDATLTNCSVENDGANIGSTGANSVATFTLRNTTAQEYFMTMKTGASGLTAVLTITVKNGETELFTTDRNVENTGSWSCTQLHNFSVGTLPVSDNLTLEIKVKSTTGSYAGNYGDLAFYAASQYDQIPSTDIITLSAGTHSGARYYENSNGVGNIKNGCYSIFTVYNNENAYVNMKMDVTDFFNAGQVKVTVNDAMTGAMEAQQTFDITASGNGQEFQLSEPLLTGLKTIRLDYITSSDKYIMNYKNLQFNKRGDYNPSATLTLKNVSVDGVALSNEAIYALKDNGGSYTLTGNIYTAVPPVVATMSNLGPATVTPQVNGNNIVYTISATNYESTLTVEGLHIYTPVAEDQTVQLKYTGTGKYDDGNWTNGLYSLLSSSLDGWENSSFKLNATENTITMPSNIKVKQLVFKSLGNNYAGNASISAVTSEGATNIWLPTKRYALKDQNYDLVVNIDGHVAGTPIVFNVVKEGQPTAWIELIVEETADGNPTVTSQNAIVDDNNAAITVNFDREVGDVTATLDGTTQLTAKGGSNKLQFAIWGLDYNTNHTLTIAKENIKDTHNNQATADVTVNFAIGNKPVVTPATFDYVVSTADEFKAALTACKESNKTAAAARKRIFVKNGTYDLGNVITNIDAHNLSIIGESKANTILSNRDLDGISTSATIQVGNGVTGTYIENLTIRNTKDWGTGLFNGGVAVALYIRGSKAILKNVSLESNQDTYVSGHRVYMNGCDIAGSVDYICGGGDNLFTNCNLINTRGQSKNGSVITAPSTSPEQQWGYVFQDCQITGVEGVSDHSYTLGRPWQGEPRAYFINTKMFQQPAGNGWSGMSNLTTHFYEYNSMDMQGNALDLSARGNSSSSTNTYTPILTEAEAAEFTVNNILGGYDCWNPAKMTQSVGEAEIAFSADDLSWTAVDDALCYVIFKDGAYYANTSATTFAVTEDGVYTVCAANAMGGMSEASNAITIKTLGTNGYSTYASESDFTVAGALVYYGEYDAVNSTVTLKEITGAVPAYEGVILKGTQGEKVAITDATGATPLSNNSLIGVTSSTTEFHAGDNYVLSSKGTETAFVKMSEAKTVQSMMGKAYLNIPAASGAKTIISIVFEGNEVTNISEIRNNGVKGADATYGIDGQRVNATTNGMIIVNGKKYVNR